MAITILILVLILFGSLYYYLFIYKLSKEKEIIKGCIKHYEAVIQLAGMTDNWRYLIIQNYIDYGLCYYLGKQNIPKRFKKWVKRVPRSCGAFWYIPPSFCTERYKAIDALQYRVDRMKELLQKY